MSAFGRVRADLAPGCPEKLDLSFYAYIWTWNRVTRPKMAAAIMRHGAGARLVRLADDRAVREWLAGLSPGRDTDTKCGD